MLQKGFRPQLAINYNSVKTQPKEVYASEKLDGCRILFSDGVAYSRSLKPFPNKLLQKLAQEYKDTLECCDGEVIYGDKYAIDVLQQSTSFCMKAEKVGEFNVYLFDKYMENTPWIDRYKFLQTIGQIPNISILEHYKVVESNPTNNEVVLDEFESEILARGGEGVMLNSTCGKYKFGRSATKNPELQKVKRFDQEEFVVVGYTQFETNTNTLERDERGYAKRSTSKHGKVTVESLGSLILALPDSKTFNAGSGFTEEQRLQFWTERDNLVGKLASIQFFGYSKDGYPLLPVFKAFRSQIDI